MAREERRERSWLLLASLRCSLLQLAAPKGPPPLGGEGELPTGIFLLGNTQPPLATRTYTLPGTWVGPYRSALPSRTSANRENDWLHGRHGEERMGNMVSKIRPSSSFLAPGKRCSHRRSLRPGHRFFLLLFNFF